MFCHHVDDQSCKTKSCQHITFWIKVSGLNSVELRVCVWIVLSEEHTSFAHCLWLRSVTGSHSPTSAYMCIKKSPGRVIDWHQLGAHHRNGVHGENLNTPVSFAIWHLCDFDIRATVTETDMNCKAQPTSPSCKSLDIVVHGLREERPTLTFLPCWR